MSVTPVSARRKLRVRERSDAVDELSDKENDSGAPLTGLRPSVRVSASRKASPLTPLQNLVSNMKQKLERQWDEQQLKSQSSENCDESRAILQPMHDNTSPGLARLRSTPANRGLKFKRRVLEEKHQETRNKSDKLCVGGGVSMWPEMDNMRLTHSQTIHLVLLNIFLVPLTVWIFYKLHGDLAFDLIEYTHELKHFGASHPIDVTTDQLKFNKDLLEWHKSLVSLMTGIHEKFDVTLSKTSMRYKLCVIMYIMGIGTLLYFLIDNVLAKNKLSPRRIKQWVSLLTVIGLWTLLSLKLLVLAQRLEQSVQDTVHGLNDYLAELVYSTHDMATFERVLLYWRTCCLPPTSRGTLTVMGIVAVQDVMYYLQYYSLPIITALLSPIIKLVVSLKEIYSTNPK